MANKLRRLGLLQLYTTCNAKEAIGYAGTQHKPGRKMGGKENKETFLDLTKMESSKQSL